MPHRYFTTEISDGTATLRGARLNSKHKMFALEEIKDFFASILLHIERASRVRRPGANLFQQGSVVLIKLVLPVIRDFNTLRFLMTDKHSVRQ